MLEPVRPEPPAEERPRPDIRSLRDLLQGPFGIRSVALTGLFILAAFYTLYLARGFFLPIVLALLFAFLFFLLASGDLFLRKLISALPRLADKRRAVEIARQIENDISAYLLTITMINGGLGLSVWGAMALLKVPNPLLWGVTAWATNYIPYLGAMFMYCVLTMVGFLTFDTVGHALLVPAAFGVCNILEAYLVTPLVLGRRLTLNPVVIFLALTFWGWLWGVTGALLAVPIMVVFKIFCDHSEPLAPIGEFLGT